MNLDPVAGALLGSLIGGLAGVGGSVLASWFGNRSAERRIRQELAIQSAIAHWNAVSGLTLKLIETNSKNWPDLPNFDQILVHKIKLLELLAVEKIDLDAVAKHLQATGEIAAFLRQRAEEKKKERG
jgi:hypothetical protein